MKLIDVLGRLLLLALRKRGSAARFCVAAGAVASLAGERARAERHGILCCPAVLPAISASHAHAPCLPAYLEHNTHSTLASSACPPARLPAESCLASQTAGSTRHGTSADVDRVLGVLGAELGGLVEASLRAAERCAVIEALLYLQVGWGGRVTAG
jgi:hypothetical protein